MDNACTHAEDQMLLALDGELDEVRSMALQKHVATCVDCRARFQRLSEGAALAAELPQAEPRPEITERILAAASDAVAQSTAEQTPRATNVISLRSVSFALSAAAAAALCFWAWQAFAPADLTPVAETTHELPILPDDRAAETVSNPGENEARQDGQDQSEEQGQASDNQDSVGAEERIPGPIAGRSPDDLSVDSDSDAPDTNDALFGHRPTRATSARASQSRSATQNTPQYESGMQHYRDGDYRQAASELERVVTSEETRGTLMAVSLLHLARSHRAQGSCATATPYFERYIREYPEHAERQGATLELAECYRRIGQFANAERWLLQAAESEHTRAQARRELLRVRTMRRARRAVPSASGAPIDFEAATIEQERSAAPPARRPASEPASVDAFSF